MRITDFKQKLRHKIANYNEYYEGNEKYAMMRKNNET